jgi:hypothetical protein
LLRDAVEEPGKFKAKHARVLRKLAKEIERKEGV